MADAPHARRLPPSGRTRIEIVADDLARDVEVDYEADMAYFDLQSDKPRGGRVSWSDVKNEDRSLIVDYDADGAMVGVEVFLVNAAVRPVTIAALKRLLAV